MRHATLLAISALLVALGHADPSLAQEAEEPAGQISFPSGSVFEMGDETLLLRPPPDPDRRAYFGDLHVHTTYSFDAFVFGTLATPYDAYRYAKGEAIEHPAGFEVKLRQPLDFNAVTDHAMFMGVVRAAADTSTEFSKLELAQPLHDLNAPGNKGMFGIAGRLRAFGSFLPAAIAGIRDGSIDRESVLEITRTAWQDSVDAAELYNDPGRFTTFVAYEYTSSSDDRGNLHRNVIFKGGDKIPALPFSRFHSQNPEGLWDWMDGLRAQGIESLAIPHNSNGSNGQMFKLVDWAGDPLDDAYAMQRIRNEPLVEITQVKGTSETHPALSPNDEWADFEIMPYRVATTLPSDPPGSYVRDALRRGLALESGGITNPYEFGFVGASDTHTAAMSDDESNFFSKVGLLDATAERRGSVPMSFLPRLAFRFAAPDQLMEVDGKTYTAAPLSTFGASGVTGVWAEENTREAIYEAFRRKETFATSGPRIRLRFFGGRSFEADLLLAPDAVSRAYASGTTMGGELPVGPGEPSFLLIALADPEGTKLQRLQVIKGWVDAEGETFEAVYDVACSGGAPVDPETHRCPDNGARVDLTDCSITQDVGEAQLRALWRDPDFDPGHRAFYYARVLENPTCRWSTWDAVRAGVAPRSDLAKTLQERAWSSPIQVVPGG
ncbi:MAG: hypothetical protein CL910_14530 [Deltaproteobacteria bacterium]|jgi:hypothetical protein|nr:hypothetical protein [Deltaproteobacteria bacterium]